MTAVQPGNATGSRWGVLALCAVAQFMVVLDVSIVNVALPQMRHDLGLGIAAQQWVVNAYTLTFAGFLMLGGRAADLFGRRRVFLLGLLLFTAASLLGGLAQSGAWLITARAVQGVGGAVLAPSSLSLLTSTFTDMTERRRAMGVWSATAASGAAAGVLAGGILTDLLDWRWVLFVNVPIGLVMLFSAPRVLSESRAPKAQRRLDVEGAFTITAGLALLVYGIVGTDTHPWASAPTITALAGGVALLAAALAIEARLAANPIVPLAVFRRRSLCAANGIAMAVGAALFGMYFFVSLYLQEVVGDSPLRTGLAILPAGLMTLAGALAAPRVTEILGTRRHLVLGPALAAVGLVWMSFLSYGEGYWTHLFVPLVLFGLGIGTTFVPMTLTATTGVPPHEAGLAAGLVNTSRQVGGALGLAVLATVAAGTVRAAHPAGAHAAQAAVTTGYGRAFLISGILLVAGAALASLIRTPAAVPAPAPAAPIGERSDGPLTGAVANQQPAPAVLEA
ncbi:MAG TPA: MFS transporter [Acidimicrobiales bacterium]|nr:MFS transporter [Acidimicrobiales bacterium]